jgi:hypothetical protein
MALSGPLVATSVVLFASCAVVAASNAEPLKREPPMGALMENERVLVDDGTCPSGQIKEVIDIKAGGTKLIERTRRCIPKR